MIDEKLIYNSDSVDITETHVVMKMNTFMNTVEPAATPKHIKDKVKEISSMFDEIIEIDNEISELLAERQNVVNALVETKRVIQVWEASQVKAPQSTLFKYLPR